MGLGGGIWSWPWAQMDARAGQSLGPWGPGISRTAPEGAEINLVIQGKKPKMTEAKVTEGHKCLSTDGGHLHASVMAISVTPDCEARSVSLTSCLPSLQLAPQGLPVL